MSESADYEERIVTKALGRPLHTSLRCRNWRLWEEDYSITLFYSEDHSERWSIHVWPHSMPQNNMTARGDGAKEVFQKMKGMLRDRRGEAPCWFQFRRKRQYRTFSATLDEIARVEKLL